MTHQMIFKGIKLPELPDIGLEKPELAYPPAIRKHGGSGDARDQLLDQLVLPQIVGLKHERSILPAVEAYLDTMPKGSTLGIEMGTPPDSGPAVRRVCRDDFFFQLERFAEAREMKVLWLERRLTRYSAEARRALRLIDDNFERQAVVPESSVAFDRLAREREAFYPAVRADGILFSEWRSLWMARTILRKNDWAASDAVMCGAVHAVHLGSILRREVSAYIGRYDDPLSLIEELTDNMHEQVTVSWNLRMKRRIGYMMNGLGIRLRRFIDRRDPS